MLSQLLFVSAPALPAAHSRVRPCPRCASGSLRPGARAQLIAWRGHTTATRMAGLFCSHCCHAEYDAAQQARLDDASRRFRRHVDALLAADDMAT